MCLTDLAGLVQSCVRPIGARAAATFLALAVAACGDPSGPSADGVNAAARSTRLARDSATAPSSGSPTSVEPVSLRFLPWAPRLGTYETTFDVVQGRASSDTIHFAALSKDAPQLPYMVLAIPADAQFVDRQGQPARPGQKIRLTVRADSQYVRFDFGPHGSTFSGNPAVLRISWWFTDLLGRPGSDQKLYFQLDDGSWERQSTAVDLEGYWLVTQLRHFSNYRVAF